MPVVDFHIHADDYPVNAPPSFVEFMDRETAVLKLARRSPGHPGPRCRP